MDRLQRVDWWNWKWTAGILCTFGLVKEFQPSEPFFVDYARNHANFTNDEIIHEILPASTYGYFLSLFILLLVTDFLRYKPIIVLGSFASIACWSMAIWSYDTKWQAQLRQVAESISLSTEIAYVTYMYANVDRSHYRRVTSYSHSALHAGRFLAGVCGQVILSYELMTLSDLNYVTFGAMVASLFVALCLPTVKRSLYFDTRFSVISTFRGDADEPKPPSSTIMTIQDVANRTVNPHSGRKMAFSLPKPKQVAIKKRFIRASRALVRDFKIAYTNKHVLKWSLWWSIALAIYLQVGIYAEPLWLEIEEETHEPIYNGGIEASHALLSSVLGICIAFIRFPMLKWGEMYLALISFVQGAVLFWMSQTHRLFIAYGCYVAFRTLFEVVIIIAAAEVAESIKEDSEAFIFGLNTLLALVIQTILTYAIADESGFFDLAVRHEFVVYAAYLGVLGIIFMLIGLKRKARHWEVSTLAESVGETDARKSSDSTIDVGMKEQSDSKLGPTSRKENNAGTKSPEVWATYRVTTEEFV